MKTTEDCVFENYKKIIMPLDKSTKQLFLLIGKQNFSTLLIFCGQQI